MVHCAVTWAQFFMSAATLTLRTLVFPFGTIQPFCNSICGKTHSGFHRKKGTKCASSLQHILPQTGNSFLDRTSLFVIQLIIKITISFKHNYLIASKVGYLTLHFLKLLSDKGVLLQPDMCEDKRKILLNMSSLNLRSLHLYPFIPHSFIKELFFLRMQYMFISQKLFLSLFNLNFKFPLHLESYTCMAARTLEQLVDVVQWIDSKAKYTELFASRCFSQFQRNALETTAQTDIWTGFLVASFQDMILIKPSNEGNGICLQELC